MRAVKFFFSTGPIGVRQGGVGWPRGGWSLIDLFVLGHWVACFSHAANTAHNPAEAYADCRGEMARKVLPIVVCGVEAQ